MFQRVYSVLDSSGWFGNPSMKKCSFLLWYRFDCGRLMNLQIWFADQNKQKNLIDSVSCMPSLAVLMSVMNYIFLCFYYWLCFPSVNTLSLLSICLISSFSESEGANLAITASFVNPISQNLCAWFIFRAGVKQKDQVTYTNELAPVQYCRGYFISAEVPVDVCRNVKCAINFDLPMVSFIHSNNAGGFIILLWRTIHYCYIYCLHIFLCMFVGYVDRHTQLVA